jgi:hypothetical protein
MDRSGWKRQGSQRLAGHTSVAFTLDRYGHLYADPDDTLRARLDEMIESGEVSPGRKPSRRQQPSLGDRTPLEDPLYRHTRNARRLSDLAHRRAALRREQHCRRPSPLGPFHLASRPRRHLQRALPGRIWILVNPRRCHVVVIPLWDNLAMLLWCRCGAEAARGLRRRPHDGQKSWSEGVGVTGLEPVTSAV